MSSYWSTADRVTPAITVDVSGTNTGVYAPGKPIDVKRIVFVVTTATTVAPSNITVGVRNADASGSVTSGTFAIPVAAVNTVYKIEVAKSATDPVVTSGEHSQPADVTTGRVDGYYTSLPGVIEVNVGQEIFVTSDGGATAGAGDFYFEYIEQGNNPDRLTAVDIPFVEA